MILREGLLKMGSRAGTESLLLRCRQMILRLLWELKVGGRIDLCRNLSGHLISVCGRYKNPLNGISQLEA